MISEYLKIFLCFTLSFQAGVAQIITTVAGTGASGYTGDGGLSINAELKGLADISFDNLGNYYLVDVIDYVVRRVDASNSISTVAGTGTGMCNYNGDGISATSANICPAHVLFNSKSNMIISDQSNHRIRKVDSSGVINTICGTGIAGNSGDGSAATLAEIKCSESLFIDKVGNIYFADFCNHNVRKIDTSGIISTIAGTGVAGFSGDNGPAISAQLNGPHSITMDDPGNLYISDHLNHRIRKIDTSGIITTIAGTGTIGYSGDGGQAILAQLYDPAQLTIDYAGNIFFADLYNHVVRKISTNGVISTIAGTGVMGYSGDNGPATSAQLKNAWGVALNSVGDIYITDAGNNVIRKVTNVGVMSAKQIRKEEPKVDVYPNPNNGTFRCRIEGAEREVGFELCNALGEVTLKKRAILNSRNEFEMENVEAGVYVLKIFCQGRVHLNKVIVSR